MSARTKGRDFRKRQVNEDVAREIEASWKAKGYAVKTDVITYSDTVHGIHSDMINGLPADLYYERITEIKRRGG